MYISIGTKPKINNECSAIEVRPHRCVADAAGKKTDTAACVGKQSSVRKSALSKKEVFCFVVAMIAKSLSYLLETTLKNKKRSLKKDTIHAYVPTPRFSLLMLIILYAHVMTFEENHS